MRFEQYKIRKQFFKPKLVLNILFTLIMSTLIIITRWNKKEMRFNGLRMIRSLDMKQTRILSVIQQLFQTIPCG